MLEPIQSLFIKTANLNFKGSVLLTLFLEVFLMKKIKMLTAMAGLDFSHAPGEELEVKNDVAKAWEEAGIAKIVVVEEPKEKVKKKKRDD
jgi:hypothetical protein